VADPRGRRECAKSLDDKAIAAYLKKNTVDTVYGTLRFDGPTTTATPSS